METKQSYVDLGQPLEFGRKNLLGQALHINTYKVIGVEIVLVECVKDGVGGKTAGKNSYICRNLVKESRGKR